MSATLILDKPPVATLSDEDITKLAVEKGVDASKLKNLDDELRTLIIKMAKRNNVDQIQPIRAQIFAKIGQVYPGMSKKNHGMIKNAMEFLCVGGNIAIDQLATDERNDYLTRATKGREIVASTDIALLRASTYVPKKRIILIKEAETERRAKKRAKAEERLAKWAARKEAEKVAKKKAAEKRAEATGISLKLTAYEMWQKELEDAEKTKRLEALETPKVTLDTGFEKPMPFSLERSLKRQARKSKRFEARRKYEKHVSKKDRFFEDVEVDFDLVRPDPFAAGICPHPEKKVYVTRNQARRFIKAYHPFDKEIHPYICECGAIHIGH